MRQNKFQIINRPILLLVFLLSLAIHVALLSWAFYRYQQSEKLKSNQHKKNKIILQFQSPAGEKQKNRIAELAYWPAKVTVTPMLPAKVQAEKSSDVIAKSAADFKQALSYPAAAQLMGMSGTLKLKIAIPLKGGTVTHVTVLKSSGHELLDDHAVEQIKKWKFPNSIQTEKGMKKKQVAQVIAHHLEIEYVLP